MSTALGSPLARDTALSPPLPPGPGRSGGWRPALRIARGELLRAKGRTLLVLVMVLLPVTAVVALDTWLRTAEVSVTEGLPRDLGSASARIEVYGDGLVRQSLDGTVWETPGMSSPDAGPTEDELLAALPAGSRLLAVREEPFAQAYRTADGRVVRAWSVGVDLADPTARGPFVLAAGRAPATAEEVAVTPDLADHALPVGSALVLPDGSTRTVTGTVTGPRSLADSAVLGVPAAVGQPADPRLDQGAPQRYYAIGPPVLWDDVLQLNALGAAVTSRAVVADPPPDDVVPAEPEFVSANAATTAAVVGLIAVMAVLEVVLLAGPAFAVGARRQRRALALLAAGGGEPRHVRRVVLAQGLLVGLVAAAVGVPLGIGLAWAGQAVATTWFGVGADEFGPFEVSARDVTLFALLAGATALLAAVEPAVVAARQPVVAALHGRRLVPIRTPVPTAAGLALVVVGTLSCLASFRTGFPELWIGFSAVPMVLGAVLLAPALLAGLGRLAGRLPLPLRYAVRDADRQRGRTAPAVAAIAATVAAAVALGVASASNEAQGRQTFRPSGPPGSAAVTAGGFGSSDVDWAAVERAAQAALPGESVLAVRGLPDAYPEFPGDAYEQVLVCRSDEPAAQFCEGFPGNYSGALGSTVLVGQAALDTLGPLLDPAALAAAGRALDSGGAAVAGATASQVELRRQLVQTGATGDGESARLLASVSAPVVPLTAGDGWAPVRAVLSEDVAARLGGVTTVGLVVGDDLTPAQEQTLGDAVALVDPRVSVLVERGPREEGVPVVLALGLVAGALVFAGTLAASSLALAEARADFGTLGAVGARPRTRRLVAGSYAAALAFAGALLGTVAGLVPGVAAAVALTRWGYSSSSNGWGALGDASGADPLGRLALVTVPWPLLAGLLLLLPLLAGAVAAAATRSRLPALGRRVQP